MAFTPVEMTNGSEVAVAENPAALIDYEFDGWWRVGTVGPPIVDNFDASMFKRIDDPTSAARARLNQLYGGGATDHGALTGLADNDHPQYALETDLAQFDGRLTPVETDLTAATAGATANALLRRNGGGWFDVHSATNDSHPVRQSDHVADLAGKVNTTDPRLSDARTPTAHIHPVTDMTATGRTTTNFLRGDNTWATPTNTTYSIPTQAEAEAGVATTARAFSAQRVRQAIESLGPLKAASEAIVVHDGTASGGTRPAGYARVRWVGGATRPTNMAAGDVWEHDA